MTWKSASFFALAVSFSAAPVSAAKRAITHEDVFLMRRVEAPMPSPDGKWVVFGVGEPSYEEGKDVSDLWIVPADGSAPARRLTQTRGGESGVTWSADSTRVAFSARRDADETSQIYVLDVVHGGEANRVTSLSTGAYAPQFRPDGRAVLFQSSAYPGAADDEANRKAAAERRSRKYKARVYDSFPIRQWDRWLEDTQRHLYVQNIEPGSVARDLLAGTQLVAAPGYAGSATNSGQDLQAVWSPDGQSVLFTASVNRHESARAETRTDIYAVSVAGGEPRKLTGGVNLFRRPTFSPDGQLYALEEEGGHIYSHERMVRLQWPAAGASTPVTRDFDRSVAGLAFSADGQTIYLTAEEAGHEKLYSVRAAGGVPEAIGNLVSGCYTNLAAPRSPEGFALFGNFDSSVNPPEVVRINPATGEPKLLTTFNTERAAAIDLPQLRQFTFTSSKGKTIHSMLALPPGFSETKKYPLFVVIHGGPHSMWRDQWVTRWNYHLLAQPGYIVLLTNYTGSTGYGEKFAREIAGDPLAGPGLEINEAADAAISRFAFIDKTRQAAGGASYGGHLANWLQASTTRYKCLISHAGLIDLESQWGTSDTIYHRELGMGGPYWEGGEVWRAQSPARFAARFRTPMLVTVGENDFRVPLNQSLENWAILQRMRIPSRLVVFPDENHWILKGENSRFFYQQVHAWLARWLGSKPNGESGA